MKQPTKLTMELKKKENWNDMKSKESQDKKKKKTASTPKGLGKKKFSSNLKGQSKITCFLEQNVQNHDVLFQINSTNQNTGRKY